MKKRYVVIFCLLVMLVIVGCKEGTVGIKPSLSAAGKTISLSSDKSTVEAGGVATITANSDSVNKFRWTVLETNPACYIAYGSTGNAGRGPVVTNPVLIRGTREGTCTVTVRDDASTDPKTQVVTYVLNVRALTTPTVKPSPAVKSSETNVQTCNDKYNTKNQGQYKEMACGADPKCKWNTTNGICETRDVYNPIEELARRSVDLDQVCSQKSFKMAFIIVTPKGTTVSKESLSEINLIKSEFSKDFNYATNGLASMDTSYPIQIMEINNEDVNNNEANLKKFYETNPDIFDFISIYGDNGINPTIAGGDHLPIQNKVNGIGIRIFDDTSYFSSSGKLKGVNSMLDLSKNEYTLNNKFEWGKGLLHETGHQWCCSVGDNFKGDKTGKLEIIQQYIHFYRGLESPYETGTPMGSDYWVSNGDGTYYRANDLNKLLKYHPFQLYFMGLLPKSEYGTKFKIYDAGGADTGRDFNFNNATFYKEVSVNDIIVVEGERKCAA